MPVFPAKPDALVKMGSETSPFCQMKLCQGWALQTIHLTVIITLGLESFSQKPLTTIKTHRSSTRSQVIKHTCFRQRSPKNCKSGNLNFSQCSLITSQVNLGNLLTCSCALGFLSEKHDSYHLPVCTTWPGSIKGAVMKRNVKQHSSIPMGNDSSMRHGIYQHTLPKREVSR